MIVQECLEVVCDQGYSNNGGLRSVLYQGKWSKKGLQMLKGRDDNDRARDKRV
jgi:hypothetical protein